MTTSRTAGDSAPEQQQQQLPRHTSASPAGEGTRDAAREVDAVAAAAAAAALETKDKAIEGTVAAARQAAPPVHAVAAVADADADAVATTTTGTGTGAVGGAASRATASATAVPVEDKCEVSLAETQDDRVEGKGIHVVEAADAVGSVPEKTPVATPASTSLPAPVTSAIVRKDGESATTNSKTRVERSSTATVASSPTAPTPAPVATPTPENISKTSPCASPTSTALRNANATAAVDHCEDDENDKRNSKHAAATPSASETTDLPAKSNPPSSLVKGASAGSESPPPGPKRLDHDELLEALLSRDPNTRALRALVDVHGADVVVNACVTYPYPHVSPETISATPLYAAAHHDRLQTVAYLIDECDADVDQGGVYRAEEKGIFHIVSPLAVAASGGLSHVVSFLLQRGATLGPGTPPRWFSSFASARQPSPILDKPHVDSTSTHDVSGDDITDHENGGDEDEESHVKKKESPDASIQHGTETENARKELPSEEISNRRARSWSGALGRRNGVGEESLARYVARPSPGAIEHALCHDTYRRPEVDNTGYCNPGWSHYQSKMISVMEVLLKSVGSETRLNWSTVTNPDELAECPLLLAARHPLLHDVLHHCLAIGMTLGPHTVDRLLMEASSWGNARTVQILLRRRNANPMFRSDGSVGLGDYKVCFRAAAAARRSPPEIRSPAIDGSHVSKTSHATGVPNNYTPLLALCSHIPQMALLEIRYGPVIGGQCYDPMQVAALLLKHGASVSARDGRGRTSLWHVGSAVNGENVDHPPNFECDRGKPRLLREYCYHMYNQLQNFGAVGYMGPGAPSSMLLNSSSIDSAEDDDVAVEWHDAYSASVQTCAICLEALTSEPITRHFSCSHVFHVSCLTRWLDKRDICPICMANENSTL